MNRSCGPAGDSTPNEGGVVPRLRPCDCVQYETVYPAPPLLVFATMPLVPTIVMRSVQPSGMLSVRLVFSATVKYASSTRAKLRFGTMHVHAKPQTGALIVNE